MTVELAYRLELTAREFRLVGLALAGRLKDHDDIADARELNLRLLGQRQQFLDDAAEVSRTALAKAGEDHDARTGT